MSLHLRDTGALLSRLHTDHVDHVFFTHSGGARSVRIARITGLSAQQRLHINKCAEALLLKVHTRMIW